MSFSLKVELNEETMAVDVKVREKVDGEFKIIDEQSFGLDGLPEEIRVKSDLYGLSKLLQDRTSATPTGPDKLADMNEIYAMFCGGDYEKERTRGAPTVSAEVEALAALKNASVAAIQKALRNYTKEQKEKILGSEAVQAKAAEIKLAREEASDVSLDDMVA